MKQRKENVKLLKRRDSLLTEKIKMRTEIDHLEQKFEKTKHNRPSQKEKKVIPIDNDTDDNDNEWETVSGNVYLYSKMHYHEKMYILYIDHWHLYYYVWFP